LTAIWIIYKAVTSFLSPTIVSITYLSVGVMVFSAVANEIMAHVKINHGKKYDNISLISDGMHSRIDVLTSIAVLIGLIVSKYFIYADSVIALLIGLYILKESFSLGKKATDSLLDVSAGEEIENKIKKIIKDEKIIIKDLKTQKRGPKVFAEISIILPNNLKVDEASKVTKKLEKKLIKNIKNIDYVAIQIASHEISEKYFKGTLGQGFGWQMRGRMHGEAIGPGGYCICPKCGKKTVHKRGIPCSSLKCPECNTKMERES